MAIIIGTASNLANGIGWKAGDGLIINNGGGNNNATMAQLNAIRTGAKTTGAPSYVVAATVTDLSVNANDLNLLDAITIINVVATNATTLTGTAAQIAVAISATTINTSTRVATTLAAGTAAASDLIIIDANTTTNVGATAVSLLTGTAAQLAKVISATTINTAANVRVTLDAGSAKAADLSAIDFNTSAVVNALAVTTITGTTTQILTALNSAGISKSKSVGVTIDAGKVTATDLTTIDGKTTAIEDATAVTAISGSAAQVKTVLASAGISLSPAVSVTLSGNVSVADLNSIDAKTTGVITATVLEHSISSLLTLTGTDNAYTISVTSPTTLNAADLVALDAKTTVNVVATAVTTLTGLATDIAAAISSATINTATNVAVIVAAGDASAADLNLIDANTTKVVGALAVTTLTGSAADIAVAITATTINTALNVGVTVDEGSASAAYLLLIDANTSAVIDAVLVTELTGSLADIDALLASTSVTLSQAFAITVDSTTPVSVAELNNFALLTVGLLTATVSDHDIAILNTFTPAEGTGANNLTIAVDNSSVDAFDLIMLSGKTTIVIDAAAVISFTGTAGNIAYVVSSGGFTISATSNAIVSGDANALDLNNIVSSLSGGIVDALLVTSITGTQEEIDTALASLTPRLSTSYTVTVSTPITVDELNYLTSLTSGQITATVSDTDIAILVNYTPNAESLYNNDITFSVVSDSLTSVAATDLSGLASKTNVSVDATNVAIINGIASDLVNLFLGNNVIFTTAINVTIDAGSANAADLTTIFNFLNASGSYTGIIDAFQVTELIGTQADIDTVLTNMSADLSQAFAITLDPETPVTVAYLNSLALATVGLLTATVSDHDIAILNTFTPAEGTGANNLTIAVDNNSVDAFDLIMLSGKTTIIIDATAVIRFTGTAGDVAYAVSSGAFTISIASNATVSGEAFALDLNNIVSSLSGGIIDASLVTSIAGTQEEIDTALMSLTSSLSTSYTITVSTPITVAELNSLALHTSGKLTATVSDTDIATLVTYTPNAESLYNNDITFSVASDSLTSVAATDLSGLASKTNVAVDATNVAIIDGIASDLVNLFLGNNVGLSTAVNVIVDAGSASATDLTTIDASLNASGSYTGTFDGTAVTEISGSLVAINAALGLTDLTLSSIYDINVADAGDLGTLNVITTTGSLILGATSNDAITVDLGTSHFSTVVLDGSGTDIITASIAVLETFVLGVSQHTGTTINGLVIGESVDIDGSNTITDLTGVNLGSAGSVLAAGDWAFDSSTSGLTYFNDIAGSAETIVLTGVTEVTLSSGDVFTI